MLFLFENFRPGIIKTICLFMETASVLNSYGITSIVDSEREHEEGEG